MEKALFNIYVASLSTISKNTCDQFESACVEILGKDRFEVRVFDVVNDPSVAETDRILAIPTIIRKFPHPQRRVIGDLFEKTNALKAVEYLINDL